MKRFLFYLIFIIVLLDISVVTKNVYATLGSCSVSVSPSIISTNEVDTIRFNVQNTSTQSLSWAKFSLPSGEFTINSGSADSWTATVQAGESVIFTSGSLPPGASQEFYVSVSTSSNEYMGDWGVQASDVSSGDNRINCFGSTSVSITNDPGDTPPEITNVSVSNITSSTVTISWLTNEASTTKVEYGGDDAYGQQSEDTTLTTSHSVTLSSLSESTVYHYRLSSNDATGNTTETNDNTFTTISSSADVIPPVISNIAISQVTSTSIKVSWLTDEAASSTLEYGTTSSYGNLSRSNALSTSHTYTISGLTPSTTYHYAISNSDIWSNQTNSSDYTFTTLATEENSSSSSAATPSIVSSIVTVTTTTISTNLQSSDKSAPVVFLHNDFSKVFKDAPLISGRVSDNSQIKKIEISIDDGKSWFLVNSYTPLIGSTVSFQYTPKNLKDGNYKLRVRATDSSGNIGFSSGRTLIIDKIAPQISTTIVSLGAQILKPNNENVMHGLEGLDTKITLSAIGGPISIDISAHRDIDFPSKPTFNEARKSIFSLAKNTDTGLWGGTLSIQDQGNYKLVARALDGAGNITEQEVGRISITDNGRVLNTKRQPIENAQVNVYYFEETVNQYVSWDGATFSQNNPQKPNKDGEYKLFLPAGKYYIQVEASGYQSVQSEIFTLRENSPINTEFILTESPQIKIGNAHLRIPLWNPELVPIYITTTKLENVENKFPLQVGMELPDFDIKNDINSLNNIQLRGKPTVVSFLSSWMPGTSTQLEYLNGIYNHPQVGSVVIFPHESPAFIDTFQKRGGYKVKFYADFDGVLVQKLGVHYLPLHLFLSNKGEIVNVKLGVLNTNDLVDNLIR